jgi:hypothetical protein
MSERTHSFLHSNHIYFVLTMGCPRLGKKLIQLSIDLSLAFEVEFDSRAHL